MGLGFRASGLGFLGIRAFGLGFRVLGLRICDLGVE
jgi:hypothetical protein